MTAIADNFSADREEPRYREGLAHLQAGRWQEAIRCFEALLQDAPDHDLAQQALADARFRASIDASHRIRARRWIVPWRAIVFRALIVALVVMAVVTGYRFVNRLFAPALAQAQEVRTQQQLLRDGNAQLAAGDLAGAEGSFTALLAQLPDHAEAQQGLAEVKLARELTTLYERGVAWQEQGQFDAALAAFTDLSVRSPAYRDVSLRIAAIKKQQELDQLYTGAEADERAGRDLDAVARYEQLKALNASYKNELVTTRLFDLYMKLGRALIGGEQPRREDLPAAAEYFAKALSLQPRNADAQLEQQLGRLYLAALSDYRAGAWERAVSEFEEIYTQRPDYLGGEVVDRLYDAYMKNGDDYGVRLDCGYAYEQYRKAAALPVSDRSLALQRQEQSRPCLTPTPTPSLTPTPTDPPTPTVYAPPTAIPAATPPPPLNRFKNQIVFRSDNEDRPGYWVMNADGSNARYLGLSKALDGQYAALIEQEKLSPDGRYHLYVLKSESEASPQVFIQSFQRDQWGNLETRQITHLGGDNYDPVWAPNGSLIAFVSNNQGSDDIWVVQPDGMKERNYTRNEWQWDKHPSWSPDSQKIVFWSNRDGMKQLYVMDANGQNVRRLREVKWDEYDPVWIK